MTRLTRREFLLLSGMALGRFALPALPLCAPGALGDVSLGRVAEWMAEVRAAPDRSAPTVRRYHRDDVIACLGKEQAPGPNPHNTTWWRIPGGYIYSAYVQPVQVQLNKPVQRLPPTGLWGEVSVPYVDVRYSPSPDAPVGYRLRYSSVYLIAEVIWGDDRRPWYRLCCGQASETRWYVPAQYVRPIPPEELAPISPGVSDKRIEISLADQTLTAFEKGTAVLTTLISGGTGGCHATPRGEHYITCKTPSRHMIGEDFDLPGVAFDAYFWRSVAIHGAYWHNDFGRPRSHGCVNVPPEAAKWLFRWTAPAFSYEMGEVRTQDSSTSVIVY